MNLNSKKFNVLSLDGGGIKGIIFLEVLKELEKKMNLKCHELFDLIIGTSTGGIAGALLARGVPASEALDLYVKDGKNIFKRKFLGYFNPLNWWGGRYEREFIDGLCNQYLKIPMRDLKTKFVTTSVKMEDTKLTHFFKSYKEKYQDKLTSEMVKRTYSAPTYFGYYTDKEGTWSDGGVGMQTCTLLESYIEIKRLGKLDSYNILNLGCGYHNIKIKKPSIFFANQAVDYLPIARTQSIWRQVLIAKELGIDFYRGDIEIPKKIDQMDAVKYIPEFIKYGRGLAKKVIKDIL